MPIVQTYPDDFGDNSKEEYLKRQLLEKIAAANLTKCEVSIKCREKI